MIPLSVSLPQAAELARRLDGPVQLMEVCGTHTMAIFRSGLRNLLPPNVKLLSGPGCPVCVTPVGYVDHAVALARRPGTVVATFGDMVRVPGSDVSLEQARAGGAQVRVVYSPVDALELAARTPQADVVFLGVGFETTAPGVAWTVREAARRGIRNYSVLCAHKTMPRAMRALLAAGDVRIHGFICPGHVSVVTGAELFSFIPREAGIPCVVAGFEAADVAEGVVMLLRQLVERRAALEIQYTRCVGMQGNPAALALLAEVFEPCDEVWRGLGCIPGSGLKLRPAFAPWDAAAKFAVELPPPKEPSGCRCGDVLRGVCTPPACPLFRARCTPSAPVGSCMVSSEGACAAWFKYGDPAVQKRVD